MKLKILCGKKHVFLPHNIMIRLFKSKVQRDHVRYQVGILSIMSIPYFEFMQSLPSEHPGWRCYPETYAKKLAVEVGIFVIAGIILIGRAGFFKWKKIPGSRLGIIPVKGRHGKEWRNFINQFKVCRI
jgi:hypothetical protein